jgi:hypothetical protein
LHVSQQSQRTGIEKNNRFYHVIPFSSSG